MEIEFIVPGEPMGKQRPKFARRGKFTTTYTPKKTREYEKKVKIEYNKVNRGKYFEGPLEINIKGVFKIPSSLSKKKQEKMIGKVHDKKPDVDNLGKIILDPLNKLAYNDDGQVSRLYVEKVYGTDPKVEVKISEINNTNKIDIVSAIKPLTVYPEPAIFIIQ